MLKQRFSNHNLVLAIFISFISVSANAQKHEWDKFPLPIIDDNNKEWKLNPQSDDFNYEFKAVNRLSEFAGKWRNYVITSYSIHYTKLYDMLPYCRSWTGPS